MFLEVETESNEQPLEDVQKQKDRQNELDLSRLQREFRYKSCGFNSNLMKDLKWLRTDFDNHTKEISNLDTVLSHVLSKQHVDTYESHIEFLQKHLECQEALDQEIKLKKIHVQQIHSQIRRLYELELKLKRNSLTDLQLKENERKVKKNYEIISQRVFVSKQQEGILIKENEELMNSIRLMLCDRRIFNKNWNRLVNELSLNKRYLIDLIERSILAFTRDEDWYARIDALENRAIIAKNFNISEILQLFSQLDADQVYQDFLYAKGFRRDLMPLDEREVKRRDFVERTLKEKLHLFWKIIEKIKEKYDNKPEVKKISKKGEKEKKVKLDVEPEVVVEESYDPKKVEQKLLLLYTIIDKHKTNDDYYFAHFKYLQDVFNTIELVSSQVIDKYQHIAIKRETQKENRNQYKKSHQNVYNDLKKMQQETVKKEKQWKEIESQLNRIFTTIHQMFKTLKCDTTFIEGLLGDNKSITNFNIKLFLSTLETTLNKILGYIHYSETKAKVPKNRQTVKIHQTTRKIIPVHVTVNTTQCSECAEREDVNRYDETVILPATQDDTMHKTKERVKANELEYRLHNLSKCRLPKSRLLVNKRYM